MRQTNEIAGLADQGCQFLIGGVGRQSYRIDKPVLTYPIRERGLGMVVFSPRDNQFPCRLPSYQLTEELDGFQESFVFRPAAEIDQRRGQLARRPVRIFLNVDAILDDDILGRSDNGVENPPIVFAGRDTPVECYG